MDRCLAFNKFALLLTSFNRQFFPSILVLGLCVTHKDSNSAKNTIDWWKKADDGELLVLKITNEIKSWIACETELQRSHHGVLLQKHKHAFILWLETNDPLGHGVPSKWKQLHWNHRRDRWYQNLPHNHIYSNFRNCHASGWSSLNGQPIPAHLKEEIIFWAWIWLQIEEVIQPCISWEIAFLGIFILYCLSWTVFILFCFQICLIRYHHWTTYPCHGTPFLILHTEAC